MVNLQLFASVLALVSGKSKPMGASLAPKKQQPERNWKQGVLCMLCMLCWYEVEPTVAICFESYFVQQFCKTFSSLVVLNLVV